MIEFVMSYFPLISVPAATVQPSAIRELFSITLLQRIQTLLPTDMGFSKGLISPFVVFCKACQSVSIINVSHDTDTFLPNVMQFVLMMVIPTVLLKCSPKVNVAFFPTDILEP